MQKSIDRRGFRSGGSVRKPFVVPYLRWWIGGILFLSTAINYIDRQTISVLAPYLKVEYHWSNSDFALIFIAFRIAYALGQTASGRFLDWLGTRKGFLLTVSGYSLAAMATSLAVGLRSFAFFRFFVGAGESANWPGAAKTVSEWFPKSERGWAVALYDSGSAVGGAIVPALALWLYHRFGSWRPPFLITGCLGFLWVMGWKMLYHSPESHPNLDPQERDLILQAKREEQLTEAQAFRDDGSGQPISWRQLLILPQTWGIILGRTITRPSGSSSWTGLPFTWSQRASSWKIPWPVFGFRTSPATSEISLAAASPATSSAMVGRCYARANS